MAAAKIAALVSCAMLILVAAVQAQSRDLQATSSIGNYQLAYNRSVVGGDPLGNLPLDDPRLQRTVQGLAPQTGESLLPVNACCINWVCIDAIPMALPWLRPAGVQADNSCHWGC